MVGPLRQLGRSFIDKYALWGWCKIHKFPNAEYKSFMTREQAMEWILPALYGTDAPSHLPQSVASPLDLNRSVGAPAAENTPRGVAAMGWHAPTDPNSMGLSDEQQYVVDLVTQGYNVFFTGAAGTSYFTSFFFLRTAPDSTQARASRSACARSSVSFVNTERKMCLSLPVQVLQR